MNQLEALDGAACGALRSLSYEPCVAMPQCGMGAFLGKFKKILGEHDTVILPWLYINTMHLATLPCFDSARVWICLCLLTAGQSSPASSTSRPVKKVKVEPSTGQ